jgi:hypothetical protein
MEAKTERSLPYKLVLERCHDLDLYRCYGKKRMIEKRDRMKTELGVSVFWLLSPYFDRPF